MAGKTPNYSLTLLDGADPVQHGDFVRDNQIIDQAMKANADAAANAQHKADQDWGPTNVSTISGSYVGDGTVKRKITLPWTPVAVLVLPEDGRVGGGGAYMGGLAVTGRNAAVPDRVGPTVWDDHETIVAITQNGFYVNNGKAEYYGTYGATNLAGESYNYVAFR